MIFAADLHLGDSTDGIDVGGVSHKVCDTYNRIEELIKVAAKTKQSVVLGGDIYDTAKPNPFLINLFTKLLRYAHDKKVSTYILPGNHDSHTNWTALIATDEFQLENIIFVHSPMYATIDGWKCFLLPHLSKKVENEIFNKEKILDRTYNTFIKKAFTQSPFTVLITHAQIQGFESSEREMEAGNAISLHTGSLPKKIKYILLGHVHKASTNVSNEQTFAYSGSVCPHNFGEIDDVKSYICLDQQGYRSIPYVTPLTFEYKQIKVNMTDKNILNIDKDKVKKATLNKLIKLVIVCQERKKLPLQEVLDVFGKYGHIIKVEVEEQKNITRNRKQTAEAIHQSIDHVKLLADFINTQSNKDCVLKLALDIGKEIIQTCCSK